MNNHPLRNGVHDEVEEAVETPPTRTNTEPDQPAQESADRDGDNESLPKCLEPWSSIFTVFEARTEEAKEIYQQILREGNELDELYRVCERKNEMMKSRIRKYLTGS
jgi:hypothetical protein